jgi:hypothetical protein
MSHHPIWRHVNRCTLFAGAMPVVLALVVALVPVSYGQVPVQIPPVTESAHSLTQGVWLWARTQYGDDTVVVSANPDAYTLAFMDDGRVAIRADCNSGSAS